jgi:hypothetical protein
MLELRPFTVKYWPASAGGVTLLRELAMEWQGLACDAKEVRQK